MTNHFKKIISVLLLVIVLIPFIKVNAATSATVNTQEELKNALQDSDITTITIGKDIDTTEKINITRPVTINGNNHTLKYVGTFGANHSSDYTTWGGIYVLQVYKTNATIKNIKLTGANAALLINGSNVTFEGNIDVSGNGFGGIELSQGQNVNTTSKLTLNNANIINTTENAEKPSLWVPDDSENAIIVINGIEKSIISGEEITLTELNQLFGIGNIESPATSDTIGISIVIGLVGLISYMYLFTVILKQKEF